MDTTQDRRYIYQLSIVVRYVLITKSENGHLVDTEVKEVFLEFYAAIRHSTAGLVSQVTTLFIDQKKLI